jgi:alpha-tubulin suppressor-like RCC1 family protein
VRPLDDGRRRGSNVYGQLGDGSFPSSPAGGSSSTAMPVSGLTSGVSAIALGGESACAITSSGEIRCWGSNGTGQLANPMTAFCG